MNSAMEFVKRHSLVIGIMLMFLLTWPIDLGHAAETRGLLPFQIPFVIYIFLGYGFVIAALTMTGLVSGRQTVVALLKRFLIWRVDWKWYIVAFLLVPSIYVIAILLNSAWSRAPIDFSTVLAYNLFGSSANLPLLFLPFLLFDAVSNGEEIGWRGYVLPRLQATNSALASSLILGVIWALWHLPKFLTAGNTSSPEWFVVDTIAKAVLLTWIYNNTNGSLLLTTLTHASWNAAGVFLPIANTVSASNSGAFAIAALLEVGAAVAITLIVGPARLTRTAPIQAPA